MSKGRQGQPAGTLPPPECRTRHALRWSLPASGSVLRTYFLSPYHAVKNFAHPEQIETSGPEGAGFCWIATPRRRCSLKIVAKLLQCPLASLVACEARQRFRVECACVAPGL